VRCRVSGFWFQVSGSGFRPARLCELGEPRGHPATVTIATYVTKVITMAIVLTIVITIVIIIVITMEIVINGIPVQLLGAYRGGTTR